MWEAVAIGGVAAGSVFLGMPIARSPRVSTRLRVALTSGTLGILLYLFVDLLTAGNQQVTSAIPGGIGPAGLAAALLGGGFIVGFAVLPIATTMLVRRAAATARTGPPANPLLANRSALAAAPFQLSMLTAVGIGMHNFAEGLAIGSTYAAGVVALSVLLAFGVIAHKSSEGFCICGCAASASSSFSAAQLGVLGLVGGGPTLLGVVVGGITGSYGLASTFVWGLAGGALISVVFLIYETQLRAAPRAILTIGIAVGFLIALGTNLALGLAGL